MLRPTHNYSLRLRKRRTPTAAITIRNIHMRIAPTPKTVRPIGSLSQAGRNGIELLNSLSPGPKAIQVPIAPNDTTIASDSRRRVTRTHVGVLAGSTPSGVAFAQV